MLCPACSRDEWLALVAVGLVVHWGANLTQQVRIRSMHACMHACMHDAMLSFWRWPQGQAEKALCQRWRLYMPSMHSTQLHTCT
jgi:hypothetical protein